MAAIRSPFFMRYITLTAGRASGNNWWLNCIVREVCDKTHTFATEPRWRKARIC